MKNKSLFIALILLILPSCLNLDSDYMTPNQDAIDRVSNGLETKANAGWWGFDPVDATESIQKAIDSRARTIVIPDVGQPWVVRPIKLVSNKTIIFDPGVTIIAKKDAFHGLRDSLFLGFEIKNVKIQGNGATLRMRKEDYITDAYEKSEHRHALDLKGCKNITISELNLESSGGDGIYIGSTWDDRRIPCQDVIIRDCVCNDNYRQGISVTSAKNLTIERCVFSNTGGTRPKSGIDLEPNHPRDSMENIVIRDCIADNNKGSGFLVALSRFGNSVVPASILLENCTVVSSYGPSVRLHSGVGIHGLIEFKNCSFQKTTYPGLWLEWEKPSTAILRFSNCEWKRVALRKTHVPLKLVLSSKSGLVEFQNCRVIDERLRPFMIVEDSTSDSSKFNVNGDIEVISPHPSMLDHDTEQKLPNLHMTYRN